MLKPKYIRLTHANVSELQDSGMLKKGNLVKYRFNDTTLFDYGLGKTENDWFKGIISDVFWFVSSNKLSVSPDKDAICYDLTVHNITDGGKSETINLELYEIFLITS